MNTPKKTKMRILVATSLVVATAAIVPVANAQAPATPAPAEPAAAPPAAPEAAAPQPVGGRHIRGMMMGRGPLAFGVPGGRGEALFEEYDADGNGTVTQAEIDAKRAAEIAEYDADGNGTLSIEEYQAFWLARVRTAMVREFQGHDIDGDGQVTAEEFNRRFDDLVTRLDRNGDGALGADDRPQPRAGGPGQQGPRFFMQRGQDGRHDMRGDDRGGGFAGPRRGGPGGPGEGGGPNGR